MEQYVRLEKYRRALGLPEEVTEEYRMLAQGEYNRNYYFRHPVSGQELVFRINYGSQMHLAHQIRYEYDALRLLQPSGRTPRPLYVDDSREELPQGIMVMEFLPGHAMEYETEMMEAADILADIHSVSVPESHGLIVPKDPLHAILEECEAMVKTYMESPLGEDKKKRKLRTMLDLGWNKAEQSHGKMEYNCCINTELNSTNFLINAPGERSYLVDWEKPLYGEPAQDLGHFLAPTTTFFKTDTILTKVQIEAFLNTYIEKVGGRFDTTGLKERTGLYLPITCLRGVTWCAMAWVEYRDPDKEIFNMSTFRKLESYLAEDFLEYIHGFISDT